MGCDIHSKVQVRNDGVWKTVEERLFPMAFEWDGHTHTNEPFDWRSYGMFGFLADVRNYSHVPPISQPRGLPPEAGSNDYYEFGDHSFSWLGLDELLAFDYDATFEDRRCMRDGDGAADSGVGNGVQTTFREFLGPHFFRDIEIMRGLASSPDDVRIVFGFDS